ncbi:MAG: hypothetical protein ISS87_02540 [Candidatus Pacebacteria bacterium]|nr:hypothetical protein [Candidatus Paceibacterota bacterium]
MKKKFLLFLLIIFLIVSPTISSGQGINPPQTIDEIKDFIIKFLKFFPDAIKKISQQVFISLKKFFNFFKEIGDRFVWGRAKKILDFFVNQIKYRISIFKTEFGIELKELIILVPKLPLP